MHKTALTLTAALLLAACDKPDTTNLAALTIPGVAPYQYLDDPVISVSVSILTLSVDLPREAVLDGQQLAADEGVSNDAIAAADGRRYRPLESLYTRAP